MKVFNEKNGWFIEKRCVGIVNPRNGCNSLLIIETGDLFVSDSEKKYDDNVFYYSVICPNCGLENKIERKFIPSDIRYEINNRQNGKVRIRKI